MTPACALTLPQLKGAPSAHVFRRAIGGNRLARLALILHELGVIRDDDAGTRGRVNEGKLVENALKRWTAALLGGELATLKNVYLVVRPDTVAEFVEMIRYGGNDLREEDVDVENSVMFALCPDHEPAIYELKARCTSIEPIAPGLAQTAVDVLEYGHWRSLLCWTPGMARDRGEMFWAEDEAAEEEGALTKSAFDAGVPTWVSTPRRKLHRAAIETLTRNRTPRIAAVAKAVLELLDAIGDRKALAPDVAGYWHTAFAAVVRWDRNDAVLRIGDDYVNDAYQGGESTDDYTMHAVKLERPEVARFLDGFGRTLRIAAATDRLLSLIAERSR